MREEHAKKYEQLKKEQEKILGNILLKKISFIFQIKIGVRETIQITGAAKLLLQMWLFLVTIIFIDWIFLSPIELYYLQ